MQGTAVPLPGSNSNCYVTHAQILVSDTVVKEYWDTSAVCEVHSF